MAVVFGLNYIVNDAIDPKQFLESVCGTDTGGNMRGVLFQTAGTIAALGVFGSAIGAHIDLMPTNAGRRWQPIVERIATLVVFYCLLLLLVVQSVFMIHLANCSEPNPAIITTWVLYTGFLFWILMSGIMIIKFARTRDSPGSGNGGNGGNGDGLGGGDNSSKAPIPGVLRPDMKP